MGECWSSVAIFYEDWSRENASETFKDIKRISSGQIFGQSTSQPPALDFWKLDPLTIDAKACLPCFFDEVSGTQKLVVSLTEDKVGGHGGRRSAKIWYKSHAKL